MEGFKNKKFWKMLDCAFRKSWMYLKLDIEFSKNMFIENMLRHKFG